MVEVIGDIVQPSELLVPAVANASLPAAPKEGMLYYDTTNSKLVVWTGAAYETVTSA